MSIECKVRACSCSFPCIEGVLSVCIDPPQLKPALPQMPRQPLSLFIQPSLPRQPPSLHLPSPRPKSPPVPSLNATLYLSPTSSVYPITKYSCSDTVNANLCTLTKINGPRRTACFTKGMHSYTLFTLK